MLFLGLANAKVRKTPLQGSYTITIQLSDQSMWFSVLVNWHNIHTTTFKVIPLDVPANMFLPIIHLILQLLWYMFKIMWLKGPWRVYCCQWQLAIVNYINDYYTLICWGFREYGGGRCDGSRPRVYGARLWSLGDTEQTFSFKDWRCA